MEWVYQHLGHTKAVHKEHYRQMSGLLERTQVSKMFLIQDLNLTSKFKGRKLDELDIKDIHCKVKQRLVSFMAPGLASGFKGSSIYPFIAQMGGRREDLFNPEKSCNYRSSPG
ncbi:hypothetical protein FSP39_007930 [Pinctada imbricata]|uniref:Uncharacterized protein n=1 Tax=Pinctada imbricata TaxID=66713 RepID=A0AA88XCA9_PINIB|nr:hypothetical protein FSP39_007930 [Pinctada imbricata]